MPSSKTSWFSVDRDGLRKLIAGKPPGFVLFELIQNAWDEHGVTRVALTIETIPGKPQAIVRVEDDAPEGFHDLTHAWTLFAESKKKGDPTQRGRFNLGEKLILSLCVEASITTTTGRVRFDKSGKRIVSGLVTTGSGSVFEATVRLTRAQVEEAVAAANTLIPPDGIATTVNGRPIVRPDLLASTEATLPTVIGDDEGVLRRSRRRTTVKVYDANGEPGWIYELGIPVVQTGDTWHYDVDQKIPLNLDRDNVPPAYLRQLRAAVLNVTADLISEDDASETWVREAASDPSCSPEAFQRSLDARFGRKRFMHDPSDPEANHRLISRGYRPVYGNQLSAGERDNRRRLAASGNDPIRPAGRISPTAAPRFSPDGEDVTVPRSRWTVEQRRVVEYAEAVALELLDRRINVSIASTITQPFGAWYSLTGGLTFNVGRLGHRWFRVESEADLRQIDSLIIHELAHDRCDNHLDSKYHEACCDLGALLALAIRCERIVDSFFFPALRDEG